ncbi:MAG TPA: hypothetical protein VNT79_14945 [Phycisphaerae bacterium]|nr:hypothetical protein [Phycisphaerae bacterium]
MPAVVAITAILGGETSVQTVPIPHDCVDGFTEAYYARPERFLDESVRRSQSVWGFVEREVEVRFVRALGDDLSSGAWDERYGKWRAMAHFEGSLRLIVSDRRPA